MREAWNLASTWLKLLPRETAATDLDCGSVYLCTPVLWQEIQLVGRQEAPLKVKDGGAKGFRIRKIVGLR